jgi:antiviral helicase SKI2
MALLSECVSAERAAEVMARNSQDTPTLAQLGRIAFRSQVVLCYGLRRQLQAALLREGCYPGEEEMEDWVFGDGTNSALLTFQAINGLEETGIVCAATWAALLGPELRPVFDPAEPGAETGTATGGVAAAGVPAQPPSPAPAAPAWEILFADGSASAGSAGSGANSMRQPGLEREPPAATPFAGTPPSKWPIVRMDDGGRPVHWLQCALEGAGCFCGEDDMLWWQFGSSTESALRTFQGMMGLPETGVSDTATWLALLGPGAQPQDLVNLSSGDLQYNDDMADHSHDGSIYLVGEQRWTRKYF